MQIFTHFFSLTALSETDTTNKIMFKLIVITYYNNNVINPLSV